MPSPNTQSSRIPSRIPIRVRPPPPETGASRTPIPQIRITPPSLPTSHLEMTKTPTKPPRTSKIPVRTSTPTDAVLINKPVSRVLFPGAHTSPPVSGTSSNNQFSGFSPVRLPPGTARRGIIDEKSPACKSSVPTVPWKPTPREFQRPVRLPPLNPYWAPALGDLSCVDVELEGMASVVVAERDTEYVHPAAGPVDASGELEPAECVSVGTGQDRKRSRLQRARAKLLKRWESFTGFRFKWGR